MAALVLSFAGAGAGSALFGASGAVLGRAIGALGGGFIDNALFGSLARKKVQGPRLSDLGVMSSTEGAPIPRVYGRARISAQLIWATKLEEVVSKRTESAGGALFGASGAVFGRAIGALGGGLIDNALFGSLTRMTGTP